MVHPRHEARRAPAIVTVGRIAFVAGLLATALALLLTFVPLRGPAVCLDKVGPGSEQSPPCPPLARAAADRANLVVAALLYGGPALLVVSGLGLVAWWAQGEEREDSP